MRDFDDSSLQGNNFLVSAVMLLKKQKRELADENKKLKDQLQQLEQQNAALVDVSANRLLQPSAEAFQ